MKCILDVKLLISLKNLTDSNILSSRVNYTNTNNNYLETLSGISIYTAAV